MIQRILFLFLCTPLFAKPPPQFFSFSLGGEQEVNEGIHVATAIFMSGFIRLPHFAFTDQFLWGMGPWGKGFPYFTIFYLYGQYWESWTEQRNEFSQTWFSNPSMKHFLFPTRMLFRSHELVGHLKFLGKGWESGCLMKLGFNRVGSSLIGESQEKSQTFSLGEGFLPYVSYQWSNRYLLELSFPFRTEVHREVKRFTNQSFSLDPEGRGFGLPYRLKFATFIPSYKTMLKFYYESFPLRYASIQYDRQASYWSLSASVPLLWSFRLEGSYLIGEDAYTVGFPYDPYESNDEGLPEEQVLEVSLLDRKDTLQSYGIKLTYPFHKRILFAGGWSQIEVIPQEENLQVFYKKTVLFWGKVFYHFPTRSSVVKRTQKTFEPIFLESRKIFINQ